MSLEMKDTNHNKEMGKLQIQCTPDDVMVDADVEIIVTGARPGQPLTISAYLLERDSCFVSHAHYTADSMGRVSLTNQPSCGGSYQGVAPMGLFWSMLPAAGQAQGLRLIKQDVCTPMDVQLGVHDGHIDPHKDGVKSFASPVTFTNVHRWYKASDVRRIVIDHPTVVAVMFVPEDGRQYPGVLDLFGTIGNLTEHRAALLASKGFVTMALGYIIPRKNIFHSDLKYFETALNILQSHPQVVKGGVGVVGVSKGADFALSLGAYLPQIKAVVEINGNPYNILVDLTWNGEHLLSFADKPLEVCALLFERSVNGIELRDSYSNVTNKDECQIPVEKGGDTQFLLVHSLDDRMVNPHLTPYEVSRKMIEARKAIKLEIIYCPGAGHLMEPPHSPHCWSSYHASFNNLLVWGGNIYDHARAQELVWHKMLEFLRAHLQPIATSQMVHSHL